MTDQHSKLHETLSLYPSRIVACSGGIDSLVLATLAHRAAPEQTIVAHTVTPAVPGPGTARVVAFAEREGWNLELVRSNEFDDERYLSNPADRCYYCKSNLYGAIAMLQETALAALPPGEDGGWAACAGGLGPRAFCSTFDVMPT